jgi:exosome complex RNA-binding protein Csl4
MDTFTKRSTETLDYDFDFSDFVPSGDVIASNVITADDGLTLTTKQDFYSLGIVKQYIGGGVNGKKYRVTCRVTTNAGRVKELSLMIKIKDA